MSQILYPLSILILLFCTPAFALDLTSYHFSDSYRYSIVDDSMAEKFPGKYVLSASTAYVKDPFFEADIVNNTVTRRIITYNQVTTIGATYYLSDFSALSAKTGYVMNEVRNTSYSYMSDSEIKGRFNMYKEGAHSISINPVVTIPTGNENNYTSAGSFGVGISAVGEMKIDQVMVQGSLGYLSQSSNKTPGIDYSELVPATLAISWDVVPAWTLNFETYRNFTVAADHGVDEGDYYLTVKNHFSSYVSIYGGVGAAGVYSPYSSNISAFIGLKVFGGK